MPLDRVGGGAAVELAAQVDEALDGAAVEAAATAADRREVQDDGLEGRLRQLRVGLLVKQQLGGPLIPEGRIRLVPGTVLGRARVSDDNSD